MESGLTYLATPYSHKQLQVRTQRFHTANLVAARMMEKGELVYSSISHTHPIAEDGWLPKSWSFWQSQARAYLKLSVKLIVLRQDGWKESVGVAAEIKIAEELGLPIEFIDP